MKISAVIPAINEASVIASAIDRAWAAGADEVIVADGGSVDATLEICRNANCELVHAQPGRGTQMNAGASAATGDVLLFLHADNWLAANACDRIRKLESSRVFGAFQQAIESSGQMFRWIESGNAARVRWRGLVYGDQAMFVSKDLFYSQGGFPAYPLMEDLAFSQQLKKRFWPVVLEGPTFVSARRWEESGPVRQTLKNWALATAYLFGASPEWLAERYRRHDQFAEVQSAEPV